MSRLASALLLSARGAHGLHAAFILPPISVSGPMLPVACALLEAGHNVTLLAWDDSAAKFGAMIPKASAIGLGPNTRIELTPDKMRLMMDLPYELMSFFVAGVISAFDIVIGRQLAEAALPILRDLKPDVLCVTAVIPSGFGLAEVLGIPAVGLNFAAPWLYSSSLDLPWSTQPHLGSYYSHEEILASLPLMAWNLAVRVWQYVVRNTLGLIGTNVARWQLGLRRLVFSQHDPLMENPSIVPSLPEFSPGYPLIMPSNAVWVGMYDHPWLGGASLGRSEQHGEIMAWLDQHSASKRSVLYCSFGSEATLDLEWSQRVAAAFGDLNVLWVMKKTPEGFKTPPSNIFVTRWAPQTAVLAHPAIAAFFSHGGANSVRESLAAGVPLIIMPLFGDQPMNAMINAELGFAIKVHKHSFNAESFASSFKEIVSGGYRERLAKVKASNDKHVSLARVVEVVENAASGLYPMRAAQASLELAWVPVLMLVAWLWLVATCLRCGCRCCRRCCCGVGGKAGKHKAQHAKAD